MSANQRGPENADTRASCLFAIDPSAVKIGKEIGKGAFSVVYKGEYNKKHVAVKCQPKDEEGNIPQFVLKEVQILQKLQHPNVLEFIGAADNRKTRQILILSEHSNNGDLDLLLKNVRRATSAHLGWIKMTEIALDIAKGIAFLHSQDMIHRDIKSSNILLDDQFRAKLCDFGFATDMKWWRVQDSQEPEGSTPARRKSYCGTDAYMAPEMFLDEDYSENVDVFSFGVVLMEILCCRQANSDGFVMRLPHHKFQVRAEEFRDALPESCPPELAQLAERCVSFEPAERPSSADVVKELENFVASKLYASSGPVELRPFTPTQREVVDCEPQLEDDEEDCGDDDDDDDDDDSGADTPDTEEEEVAHESAPVLPPPYHTGLMFKRNRRGNRGWSEKQFILDQDQLHYTDVPAKTQQEQKTNNGRRTSHPAQPSMSSLSLKDCRIWKTMEMQELSFNILTGSWKIIRELRAANRGELDTWMALINQAIDFANDQGTAKATSHAKASFPEMTNNCAKTGGSRERLSKGKTKQSEERRPESAKKGDDVVDTFEDHDDEVYQWLMAIGLQRYTATLKGKGFGSLDFIRETGIEKDDLNFLGIKCAAARKSLILAARTLRGEE